MINPIIPYSLLRLPPAPDPWMPPQIQDSTLHPRDPTLTSRVRIRQEPEPIPQQPARQRRAPDNPLVHLSDRAQGLSV